MYLYKTQLHRDTTNVNNPPASNDNDVVDFDVAGKKGSATKINEIVIQETTFITVDDYATFDGRVDGTTIVWSDVKYIEDASSYTLYLSSDTAL